MTKHLPKREVNAELHFLAIIFVLWLVLSLVPSLSAQTSSVPYDQCYGPLFHLTSPSYVYRRSYRSIHDVDFQNLPVNFLQDENGRPLLSHLRDGKCEVDFHPGHTSIEIAGVHYLNSSEKGREYALVLYEEDDVGGSSNQEGIAQVFELADKRLRIVQKLEWDLHYGGPYGKLDTFDERINTLKIVSSHYQPGDGHCCVSAVDIVIFRWDGRRLRQVSVRTELSDHGKSDGRKLGRF